MASSPHHSPGFLAYAEDARSRVREVTRDEMRARLSEGNARLIDVREDDEWKAGHIPGAEHIGKGVMERDIEAKVPDRSTELVLYCGGGYRSAIAADALARMGYTNVASMIGGWRGWIEANGEVARSDA